MGAVKLSIRVENFKPLRSHSRYGFADLVIPEVRLRIKEVTVHQSGERRWIGLPGRPQLDREGQVRRDERGKVTYVNILQFTDRDTADRFSDRAIAALVEAYPDAFAEEGAP